jgi:hypothetical protein
MLVLQYSKRNSAPIGPETREFRGELPPIAEIDIGKSNMKRKLVRGDAIALCRSGGIMSRLKLILPVALVLGGFLATSTQSYGKAEYTKQTKKACVFCHVDSAKKPKELKDAGKYFQEHKSLDGYQEKK